MCSILAGEAGGNDTRGPLVHIVFASVWAYHIGRARLEGRSVLLAVLVWLPVTALLHGTYDFVVLGFSGPALGVSALVIVAIWLWRLKLIRTLAGSPSRPDD